MSDPVDVLAGCGGAARWEDLRERGVSRRALLAAVHLGAVLHRRHGVYALPSASAGRLAAVEARAVLSCSSALADHGIPLLRGDTGIHLVAGRGSRTSSRGCVVHRRVRPHDGVRVDLPAALADAAGCLPVAEAVAAADAALGAGRVRLDDVPAGRDWARVVPLLDPAAQSVLEPAARVALVLAGLGPVESQVGVPGVGHVDLLVAGWLVVETDGFAFHSDRTSFRTDRRRDAELTRRGYVVLRVTWEDVLRPGWLVALVREALGRGRPPFWTASHVAG